MVNVAPKLATLASEVGNKLLRGHAGLPLNRRDNEKTQTPKVNQAMVMAPTGLNLTVALTNFKVVSIILNLTVRNLRQLNTTGVVIMLASPTLGNPTTKTTMLVLTLISQQSRGFSVQG